MRSNRFIGDPIDAEMRNAPEPERHFEVCQRMRLTESQRIRE
jgi:hypothetical protein